MVKIFDFRADTGNVLIGRITTDLYQLKYRLKPDSLYALMTYAYLKHANNDPYARKLIIRLHTFHIMEGDAFSGGKTHFRYEADYFISEGANKYTFLGNVDTLVNVSGFDIVQKTINTFDQYLCVLYESLYESLGTPQASYTYDEVLNYDDIQKKLLPAYTDQPYKNGVYYSWEDFVQLKNVADRSVALNGKKFNLMYKNSGGKLKNAPIKYAIVFAYDGVLYYNLEENAPCEIYKKENDFFIKAKIGTSRGYTQMGLLPFLMTNGTFGIHAYEFKINYRNGRLIPVEEISTRLK